MRRSHRFTGFTLVELLVVITIIGLLAALIVPAVSGALETARRNTCNNNLSQIGLGAYTYATSKGYYPGYLNPKLNTSAATFPSWHIVLLSTMGRENVYNNFVANTVDTPYLEMYVCPSDNTAIGQAGPFTSYSVNTGKSGNSDTNSVFEGICHNLTTSTAKQRRVTLDSIPDGADMTILAVENVDANKYYDTGVGADPEDILGISWGGTQQLPNKNTGKRTTFSSTQDFTYARPSSNHSGVFNAVFAGRNTKTIDEAIDKTVWEYLMTPNGKKVTPVQNSTTVLNKEF
jgi:prepilin-type N-terminal cleavage/methylation domain-containing protein